MGNLASYNANFDLTYQAPVISLSGISGSGNKLYISGSNFYPNNSLISVIYNGQNCAVSSSNYSNIVATCATVPKFESISVKVSTLSAFLLLPTLVFLENIIPAFLTRSAQVIHVDILWFVDYNADIIRKCTELFQIFISGSGFYEGSFVVWDAMPLTTKFYNSSTISVKSDDVITLIKGQTSSNLYVVNYGQSNITSQVRSTIL